MSRFAAECGKGFRSPVTEVDWYWLLAMMAEAPTAKELKSVSGIVKRPISVLSSNGLDLARLTWWPSVKKGMRKRWFPLAGVMPNRQRWVKE